MSNYLVTFALPYANGPLHIGHMVEMIDADIWVRSRRLAGDQVVFVSGNDAHGTPIMLKAASQKITEEQLVSAVHLEHKKALESYNINLDVFSRTDKPSAVSWVHHIYEKLEEQGLIQQCVREQAYDEKEQMFLPDRYVIGTCPKCDAKEQNGDNCEVCGASYDPRDLKDPLSVLNKLPVSFKPCEGLELILEKEHHYLSEAVPNFVPKSIMAKFDEWLCQELKSWSISRQAPYHGVRLPDKSTQHFYVWFDAPIGYLSFFDEALKETGQSVEQLLKPESSWQMVHFIGKDIAYFHGLFWPILLKSAGLKAPDQLFVHGFLNVQGQKMSKSKGTFIEALKLAQLCPVETVRYYLASKMNGQIDDMNFDLEHFVQKVNSDIIGKFINIISRLSKLLFTYAHGRFHESRATDFTQLAQDLAQDINQEYKKRRPKVVIEKVMALCDQINEQISQLEPWKSFKDPALFENTHRQVSDLLLAFREICYYLKPIIPEMSEKLAELFDQDLGLKKPYEPLIKRLDLKQFKEICPVNTQQNSPAQEQSSQPQKQAASQVLTENKEQENHITIDEFLKVDLRVAHIKEVNPVEGADKLVQLTLDIKERTLNVFAGIKKHYELDDLLGKKVIACVNLKPRKMKFGLSEGMILAASCDKALSVLCLDRDVEIGSKVS